MKIGYLIQLPGEADITDSIRDLHNAGCTLVVKEPVIFRGDPRPRLEIVLQKIGGADQLIVLRLRDLGTVSHLLKVTQTLEARSATLECLEFPAGGPRNLQQVLRSLADLEKALQEERQQVARRRASSEGTNGGRPRKLGAEDQENLLKAYHSGTPVPELLRAYGLARSTFYQYLKEARISQQKPLATSPKPSQKSLSEVLPPKVLLEHSSKGRWNFDEE